jgi:hypothetical protein
LCKTFTWKVVKGSLPKTSSSKCIVIYRELTELKVKLFKVLKVVSRQKARLQEHQLGFELATTCFLAEDTFLNEKQKSKSGTVGAAELYHRDYSQQVYCFHSLAYNNRAPKLSSVSGGTKVIHLLFQLDLLCNLCFFKRLESFKTFDHRSLLLSVILATCSYTFSRLNSFTC